MCREENATASLIWATLRACSLFRLLNNSGVRLFGRIPKARFEMRSLIFATMLSAVAFAPASAGEVAVNVGVDAGCGACQPAPVTYAPVTRYVPVTTCEPVVHCQPRMGLLARWCARKRARHAVQCCPQPVVEQCCEPTVAPAPAPAVHCAGGQCFLKRRVH